MKKRIALLLALTLLLTGCGSARRKVTDVKVKGTDLMAGVKAADVALLENLPEHSEPLTNFSVELFQNSMKPGENTLISPLSVLYALGMTANGAQGNTLSQMETVMGLPREQLNNWLHTYAQQGGQQKLFGANSIWFQDDPNLSLKEEFLQTNADYYGAELYQIPFDDAACDQINKWVEGKTAGMIKNILYEIPEEAVMYLINALAFESRWDEPYEGYQVRERTFTTEDGQKRTVDMMYSGENNRYLEDDLATGFYKWYEGYRYYFVALLPKEGVSVEEYVQSLTGEHLQQLLAEHQQVDVKAGIPQFEAEFNADMAEILSAMGMPDAFSRNNADFSCMGSYGQGDFYITRVLHKTFISVEESGTKAAAATVVEAAPEAAAPPMEEEIKEVILDRPFVYLIVDNSAQIPVFMGTVMDIQ